MQARLVAWSLCTVVATLLPGRLAAQSDLEAASAAREGMLVHPYAAFPSVPAPDLFADGVHTGTKISLTPVTFVRRSIRWNESARGGSCPRAVRVWERSLAAISSMTYVYVGGRTASSR